MKILVLCTGNSCRSQMAEGLIKHMAGETHEVFSAGVNPTAINPLAIKAMWEVGIDISHQRSKSIDEYLKYEFDYVITVCDNARQNCPVFPGHHQNMHWDLADPALAIGSEEERMRVFRKIRDQVKGHINKFIGESAEKGKQ